MGNMKALVVVVLASLFVVAPVSAVAVEKIAVVDIARAIFGLDKNVKGKNPELF